MLAWRPQKATSRPSGPFGGDRYMNRMKVLVCSLFPLIVVAQTGPTIGGCPVFPANNVWNQPVDNLPLHSLSSTYVNAIGASAVFRLDDVLPINIVPSSQPEAPVNILAVDESDHGGYAIPRNPQVE